MGCFSANVLTYTSALEACGNSDGSEAVARMLFERMHRSGVKADKVLIAKIKRLWGQEFLDSVIESLPESSRLTHARADANLQRRLSRVRDVDVVATGLTAKRATRHPTISTMVEQNI